MREHSLALSRFESAAWSIALSSGGRLLKMIGDEAFFAAPSVDTACHIATELCAVAEQDPLLPPARGAIGFGTVMPREGDYFGPLVNLVARLVKAADPGTVVATEAAASGLAPARWSLSELGARPLRGVERPVRSFVVRSASAEPVESSS